MPAYRSTKLKLADQHCARALDYDDAGAPRDREVFQVGIAAHAVLQIVGEAVTTGGTPDLEAISDAVTRELVTRGRAFEGQPEPPMAVATAAAGRDLALAYLRDHELSPSARYEQGLAVDRNWQPVPYDSAVVYYRAALDVLDVLDLTDDDGYPTTLLLVADWKSAWPTSATELETTQLRGQAAVALAHYPQATVVRRRVVNLRTRMDFEVDLVMDDDGAATVARWRKDIDLAILAAEVRGPDGRRPARPGATCLGCPYLTRCDAARDHFRGTALDGSAEAIATRLAVADALYDELFAACKALAAEGTIEIAGGRVGFVETAERKGLPDAGVTLAHRWLDVSLPDQWNAENGAMVGLLTALSPGVTAVEKVAKILHPAIRGDKSRAWAAARDALTSACIDTHSAPKFGIHKDKPSTEETSDV